MSADPTAIAKTDAVATRRPLDAGRLIDQLTNHRQRQDRTGAYWDEYCDLIGMLCRATAVIVVQLSQERGWATLGTSASDAWLNGAWRAQVDDIGARAQANGFAYTPVLDDSRMQHLVAFVRTTGVSDMLIVLDIPERERPQLNELIMRALLASDFPIRSAGNLLGGQASRPQNSVPVAASDLENDALSRDESLYALMDLAAQVMAQPRFAAAAMLLVNGIAAHYQATQVALGWVNNGAVRVVGVSHLDRFERNTQNVSLLEDVFRDALGHGAVVRTTHGSDAPGIASARDKLAATVEFVEQVCLPAQDAQGLNKALLFVGFAQRRDDIADFDALHVILGFVLPRLETLRELERGIGHRAGSRLRHAAQQFFGPEATGARVATFAALAALGIVTLVPIDFHVEASAKLTTDSSRVVSVQFDSRVEKVVASAGDLVKKGDELAVLDTRELRQQVNDIVAERQRLLAETDKARAADSLAETVIAQARLAQADARLARVMYYMGQARAVAPFDGVVVEGERKELMNAPVKKGDRLFKVARIDGLYIEMMVPERDIRHVRRDAMGTLRLVARPDLPVPLQLTTIIPMAQVKGQEGNHFLVKAKITQEAEAWWRPGMSGVVQIDAGQETILWVWTHRLIDTLRMKLWWMGW